VYCEEEESWVFVHEDIRKRGAEEEVSSCMLCSCCYFGDEAVEEGTHPTNNITRLWAYIGELLHKLAPPFTNY
jgi:hypothetical protein